MSYSSPSVLSDLKVLNYSYDSFSRLSSYTDTTNGKTVSYTYDSYGNITSEITSMNNGTTTTATFSYDNLNRIISVNGAPVSYYTDSFLMSSIGYSNLYYSGKRLMSISGGSSSLFPSMSFTYDYRGRRTSKTVNNLRHDYYYDEDRLIYETITNNSNIVIHKIVYYYDEKGLLSHLNVDNNNYFYYVDSFYNVRGLYDENGIIVVKYEYDPWGNVTSIVDNSNIGLSTLNPFLYKSYYYDHESHLYYCLSRYYIPFLKRWLTIDDVSYLNTNTPNGYNLYIYCNNNPVMYRDEKGRFAVSIGLSTLVTIGLVSFAFGLYTYLLGEINEGEALFEQYNKDSQVIYIKNDKTGILDRIKIETSALIMNPIQMFGFLMALRKT